MASLWNVRTRAGARRQLRQLDENVRLEAVQTIAELTEDPFPTGFVQMEGYSDLYRVRFCGDRYRIVYQVKPKTRLVVIAHVGPRDTVYQHLRKPGAKRRRSTP
ncbi:MAG: type II toxin-antitoxin system RelE/ParE family toxin [Acidobacteriia bacterium]|nr:type II toxin-antitoxin system RelE/ParE family toxin [Terriglobia bacterium]